MNVLFNIFGPSAAGKSTIVDLLQARISGLRIVDYDIVKRSQIPNYHWREHAALGHDLTLELLADTLKDGFPTLLLVRVLENEAEYKRIESLLTGLDYTLLNIELTAPKEVLIERYKDRLANLSPEKKHWKFRTVDEFTARLEEPYYKPPGTLTFDTSELSPNEILEAITLHVATFGVHLEQ